MSRNVALYARASSKRQADQDLSVPAQLDELRSYAQERGWHIINEFKDEGRSGKTVARREAFASMIALAKQEPRKIDAVLVWKFSRFARSRADSAVFKAMLRKGGVEVVSIKEPIDDSPSGFLHEGMIELFDEYFIMNLAQDTLRGMKKNAELGYYNGGCPPTGYRVKQIMVASARKAVLDRDEVYAPVVERMYRMCAEGCGAKEIAKTLNDEGFRSPRGNQWSKTSVLHILKNEVYTGVLVWNGGGSQADGDPAVGAIRVEGRHPALVDKKLFSKVQRLIEERGSRQRHPREINSDYLLSGRVVCGKCGQKMIGSAAKSGKYHYYACQNFAKRGKSVCDAKSVSRESLEKQVIEHVGEEVLTAENIRHLVDMVNAEMTESHSAVADKLAGVGAQVQEREKRLQSLYNALETGKLEIDDLAPRIKELRSDIALLESKRDELESLSAAPSATVMEESQIRSMIADLTGLLRTGSLHDQRSFLRSFIKGVTVTDQKVDIAYLMPQRPTCKPRRPRVLPMDKIGSA